MTTLRLPAPIDDAEIRMRRALRLESPSSGGRSGPGTEARGSRRFAQPGDVPVTRLAGKTDGPAASALAALEEALQAERVGREQAEAALAQASATIVTLQTKLAHAEIAHAEAMAEQRWRHEAELKAANLASSPSELPKSAPVDPPTETEAEPADHEEPVQWWVPGWQGSFRR